jgi:hypothetical protein
VADGGHVSVATACVAAAATVDNQAAAQQSASGDALVTMSAIYPLAMRITQTTAARRGNIGTGEVARSQRTEHHSPLGAHRRKLLCAQAFCELVDLASGSCDREGHLAREQVGVLVDL